MVQGGSVLGEVRLSGHQPVLVLIYAEVSEGRGARRKRTSHTISRSFIIKSVAIFKNGLNLLFGQIMLFVYEIDVQILSEFTIFSTWKPIHKQGKNS